MAEFDGEERVKATAHQIARSFGNNADDMFKILSTFDHHRFSNLNEMSRTRSNASAASSREGGVFDGEAGGFDGERIGYGDEETQDDLDTLERVIRRHDSSCSDRSRRNTVGDSARDESVSYLRAVDDLQDMLETLSMSPMRGATHDRAQSLKQHAMEQLEEEFRRLLIQHSDAAEPEWLIETYQGNGANSVVEDTDGSPEQRDDEEDGDEDIPVARPASELQLDFLPVDVVMRLGDIARRMIAGGCERECRQVYSSVRRSFLEESLGRLGLEKLSWNEVQRTPWDALQPKIKKWIQAITVSVKVLFPSEGRHCDQIFDSVASREACFAEVARNAMMDLLKFSELIAASKRAPEKLFKILDMYEALRDLIPEIEAVFTGEAFASVRVEAGGILMRLGEAARATFAEFENAINRDSERFPLVGGSVHPLTRYVMNYITFLFDYTDTLKELYGDKKEGQEFPGDDSSGADGRGRNGPEKSALAVQTMWITHVLENNLLAKSKLYKDQALTYLFLMNNVHYIAKKVKTTEVRSLLGDEWVKRHSSLVKQHHLSYQRAAWQKVLQCLKDEGIHTTRSAASSVSRVVLKERFKNFNVAFEEVHKQQSTWVVPDLQLRSELRIAIGNQIVPAYTAFLGRYKSYLETGRHPERYIKFTSEDVETYVNDLFKG